MGKVGHLLLTSEVAGAPVVDAKKGSPPLHVTGTMLSIYFAKGRLVCAVQVGFGPLQ